MKRFFALIAALVLMASCAKESKTTSATEEKKPSASSGPYLAKVGGKAITEEDVKDELKALPPQVRTMFLSEGGVGGFIDELVKKELLYQEAGKKGFEGSDRLKKKMEDFKKLMMIELLLEDVIEKKSEVTEKDARDFYEKNKAEFTLEKKKGKKEVIEFERVKDLLVQRLRSERQKQVFETYLSELKNAYTIEINKDAIAALSEKESADAPKELPGKAETKPQKKQK